MERCNIGRTATGALRYLDGARLLDEGAPLRTARLMKEDELEASMSTKLSLKSHIAVLAQVPSQHHFSDQILMRFPSGAHVSVGTKASALIQHSYKPGEMVLCRRDVHEWSQWLAPASFQTLTVSDEGLRRAAEEHGLSEPVIDPAHLLASPSIALLLQALEAEGAHGESSDPLCIESINQAIATILVRTRTRIRYRNIAKQEGLAPWQLRRAMDFINAKLHKPLSIRHIAAEVQLSPVYFAQRFRQSTGISPHVYVLQRRIELSKALLMQEPQRSVLDVALASGFKTQQHFARVFRRHTSLSPTRFCHLLTERSSH
jgi:AraC family transcriptional regulator